MAHAFHGGAVRSFNPPCSPFYSFSRPSGSSRIAHTHAHETKDAKRAADPTPAASLPPSLSLCAPRKGGEKNVTENDKEANKKESQRKRVKPGKNGIRV